MSIENTVKNLVAEKNKHAAKIQELESRKSLNVENLQIGNITIIGSGEYQGIWVKKDDGSWYKANI